MFSVTNHSAGADVLNIVVSRDLFGSSYTL